MFEVIENWGMCDCANNPRSIIAAIKDLCEEVVEFAYDPSYYEASNVAYCIGRLLGGLIGKVYISVPGDQITLGKMRRCVMDHGCIRSRRHLINGKCPKL